MKGTVKKIIKNYESQNEKKHITNSLFMYKLFANMLTKLEE